MNGEWVEIEPGTWEFFMSMPLSDEEAIEQFIQAKTDIRRFSAMEREIKSKLGALENRRHQIVGDWLVRHTHTYVNAVGEVKRSIGDGRDMNSVAPKTTAQIGDLRAQLHEVQLCFDDAHRRRALLMIDYPATLLKAGLFPIARKVQGIT